MKKIILSLMAASVAGLLVTASAQPAPPGDVNTNAQPAGPPGLPPDMGNGPDAGGPPPGAPDANMAAPDQNSTNQVNEPTMVTPSQKSALAPETVPSPFMPPAQVGTNFNDLTLNYNRAPLDLVLNYLSDAAGFVIVQDTTISSSALVTVKGQHLSRDEAVNLLNGELNKNGYAAIRDGRTLTIVDKNDAKTREIPVKTGNIPENIPKNAEIVTWIIHPVCRGAATRIGFVLVRVAAGHGGGQRGGQFHRDHRHPGEHSSFGGDHQGGGRQCGSGDGNPRVQARTRQPQ
jgi:hypothetical protein